MPLRRGHFRVLAVASLGQIVGAGLATLIGVILPMIQMMRHTELSSLTQGAVAATSLVGIMVGSILFGAWSDRRGYLLFFRICPVIIFVASLAAYFADSLAGLVVGLFLMGFGIGGEYSLDSDYVSEIMPRRWRLLMVGCAKATSSIGNIVMAAVCFVLLRRWGSPESWRSLLLLVSVFAAVMFVCRLRFTQSPGWLVAHGRPDEAERAVHELLGDDVDIGEIRNRPKHDTVKQVSWGSLFRGENATKVAFSGIPWACEGFGVYGIGVFLPVLVMAFGLESTSEKPFERLVGSVELTFYINMFVLAGFAAGLTVMNRWRHTKMQTWGFVLCAAGLALLLAAYKLHLPLWIAVGGFMFFELFLNAGPHLLTFVFPSQIYSVEERGAGAGLAAAFGKSGAVLGVLFMPMLLKWGGAELVLTVTIAAQLLGATVTALLGRKVMPPKVIT